MPTTLEQEFAEQSRWRMRPDWAANAHVIERILRNEFAPESVLKDLVDRSVRKLMNYAGAQIPHYRDWLREQRLMPEDIRGVAELPLLPIVTKRDIQELSARLQPQSLPQGQRLHGIKSTSGSTGQPTRVPHTVQSILMQSVFSQRDARWCRFDPTGTFAYLRMPADLQQGYQQRARDEDGGYQLPRWTLLGNMFETGPAVGMSALEPLDAQLRWLRRTAPTYFNSHASRLEHLALALQDEAPVPSIRAIKSVAQQLTPAMRARVEQTFGVPVHQNYGFNEIGTIAIRCQEGGRYHVNVEHCWVEIVDAGGRPCRPGQQGRMLVTAFNNAAMVLIRYEPDDMAAPAEGPCPCGRTLPAFSDIQGRYNRTVALPEGTTAYWMAIESALGVTAPRELTRSLRQYQLHQFLDRSFELRLVLAGKPPSGLDEHIHEAWRRHGGEQAWPLTIKLMDDIPRPPGGKFQSLSSDFTPAPVIPGASGQLD